MSTTTPGSGTEQLAYTGTHGSAGGMIAGGVLLVAVGVLLLAVRRKPAARP
ncbi:MAG: LPXTG cell wall anchor domain-containing protein [Kutzneria sp.]|nr:LPXTG cell wall anchor domain-containing protein [Kutzneria sp.]